MPPSSSPTQPRRYLTLAQYMALSNNTPQTTPLDGVLAPNEPAFFRVYPPSLSHEAGLNGVFAPSQLASPAVHPSNPPTPTVRIPHAIPVTPSPVRVFTASLPQLPHDHFSATEDECPICTENDARATVQTQCNHIFHRTCLRTWLTGLASNGSAGTCPYCRNVLFAAVEPRSRTGSLSGEAAWSYRSMRRRGLTNDDIQLLRRLRRQNELSQLQPVPEHQEILPVDPSLSTRQGYVALMRAQRRAETTRTAIFNPRVNTSADAVLPAAQAYVSPSVRTRPMHHTRANPQPATVTAFTARGRRHSSPAPRAASPRPDAERVRDRAAEAERHHVRRLAEARFRERSSSDDQNVQSRRVQSRRNIRP